MSIQVIPSKPHIWPVQYECGTLKIQLLLETETPRTAATDTSILLVNLYCKKTAKKMWPILIKLVLF